MATLLLSYVSQYASLYQPARAEVCFEPKDWPYVIGSDPPNSGGTEVYSVTFYNDLVGVGGYTGDNNLVTQNISFLMVLDNFGALVFNPVGFSNSKQIVSNV